jgi:hypothetical protein
VWFLPIEQPRGSSRRIDHIRAPISVGHRFEEESLAVGRPARVLRAGVFPGRDLDAVETVAGTVPDLSCAGAFRNKGDAGAIG